MSDRYLFIYCQKKDKHSVLFQGVETLEKLHFVRLSTETESNEIKIRISQTELKMKWKFYRQTPVEALTGKGRLSIIFQ